VEEDNPHHNSWRISLSSFRIESGIGLVVEVVSAASKVLSPPG
jgi:hypothetical protein